MANNYRSKFFSSKFQEPRISPNALIDQTRNLFYNCYDAILACCFHRKTPPISTHIFHKESRYQHIDIFRDAEHYRLNLNRQIQMHSEEWEVSHYIQCGLPVKRGRAKRILILGGGDGLCATMVLRYPWVESVTQVELDQNMIDMWKYNPFMRKITGNSAHDPRLTVVVGDAFAYIEKQTEKNIFDLLVEDIEYDFTNQDRPRPENYIRNCLKISKRFVLSEPDDDAEGMNSQPVMYKLYMAMLWNLDPSNHYSKYYSMKEWLRAYKLGMDAVGPIDYPPLEKYRISNVIDNTGGRENLFDKVDMIPVSWLPQSSRSSILSEFTLTGDRLDAARCDVAAVYYNEEFGFESYLSVDTEEYG